MGVIGFQVRHTGVKEIPARGAVLVVCNHQSNLDPLLVGTGCPRRMNYLARHTLFRFAPFAWLLHSVDAIPIRREGVGLEGMKESLRRLKRGEMVLVFPEGTRTRDGEISAFRHGFTTLAVHSGASILPAALEGPFAAWPRGKVLPRPGPVRVHYGPPIWPEEASGMDERELGEEVEHRVRACLARLRRLPCWRWGRRPRRGAD